MASKHKIARSGPASPRRADHSDSETLAASEDDTSEYMAPASPTPEEEKSYVYWKQRALRAEKRVAELEALLRLGADNAEESESESARPLSPRAAQRRTHTTPSGKSSVTSLPLTLPLHSAAQETLDEPDLCVERGVIKCASVARLLERVTGDTVGETPWDANDFLLTFSLFTDTRTVWDFLVPRFVHTDREAVRGKVVAFLNAWLTEHFATFAADTSVVDEFLRFCDHYALSDLKATYYSRKDKNPDASRILAKPILPDNQALPLLEWDPMEIARQITLLDWEHFKQIGPAELAGLPWTKPRKEELAPHVMALTRRFNALSGWVCTVICATEKPKDRVRVMRKVLVIADKLKQIGNFNSMMAIQSGFDRSPVYRMKESMAALLSESKYARIYEEIKALADSRQSYAALRQAVKTRPPPTLPYLGIILTDFTFIEEGNKEVGVGGKEHLVNCIKMRLFADQFRMLRACQRLDFLYTPVAALREMLADLVSLDEDTLYSISMYLEPKEGASPGPRPSALDDAIALLGPAELSSRKKLEIRRRQSVGHVKSRSVVNTSNSSVAAALQNALTSSEADEYSEDSASTTEDSFFPATEELCTLVLNESLEAHVVAHRETFERLHAFLERTDAALASALQFLKSMLELWRPSAGDAAQSRSALCRSLFFQYLSTSAPRRVVASDAAIAAVKESLRTLAFDPDPFEAVLAELMPALNAAWERYREAIRTMRDHSSPSSRRASLNAPLPSPRPAPSPTASPAPVPTSTSSSSLSPTPLLKREDSGKRNKGRISRSVKEFLNTDVSVSFIKKDKDKDLDKDKEKSSEKSPENSEKDKSTMKAIDAPPQEKPSLEKPTPSEKPTPPAKPLPLPRLSSGNIPKHALSAPSSAASPTVPVTPRAEESPNAVPAAAVTAPAGAPATAPATTPAAPNAPSSAPGTPVTTPSVPPRLPRPSSARPVPQPKALVWVGVDGVGRRTLVKRLLGHAPDAPAPALHSAPSTTQLNGIPCEFSVPEFQLEATRFEQLPRAERFEGVVLVFAVTSRPSLAAILRWWQTSGRPALPAILVGNKSDARTGAESDVPVEMARALAERLQMKYFEVAGVRDVLPLRLAVQSLIETLMLRKILAAKPLVPAPITVVAHGPESSYRVVVLGRAGSGRAAFVRRVVERSWLPSAPLGATADAEEAASAVWLANGVRVQFVTPPSVGAVANVDAVRGLEHAAALLLVYDLTDADSFAQLAQFVDAGTRVKSLPTVMVSTHIDESARRQVPLERAVQWGAQQGVKVFEVSAKLGLYCQLAAEYLVELVRVSSRAATPPAEPPQ